MILLPCCDVFFEINDDSAGIITFGRSTGSRIHKANSAG